MSDKRLLVVGDIHGQYEKMQRVLIESNYDPQKDRLILLGDYVDRGPESRRVSQAVMELVQAGAVALCGNHEDMMRRALAGQRSDGSKALDVEQWYANGGETTLASYRAQASLLRKHLAFFADLPYWHEDQGFLFVHAGLRPGISIEKQSSQDLIWIREEYILGYAAPRIVVSGHTPTQYLKRYELFPDIEEGFKPVLRDCKYFLDTGAAWGGPLTIMDVMSKEFWQAF